MIKCTFTSVWDDGKTEITTDAEYNPETREVSAESADVSGLDLDILDEQYIKLPDGKILDICNECQKHTLNISTETHNIPNTNKTHSFEVRKCPTCGEQ